MLFIFLSILFALSCVWPAQVLGAPDASRPLASLQSYTGLWHMPNARVLPDWSIRLKYGYDDPWRYYGGALGLWDRLEIHGQFTDVTSVERFPGEGGGSLKDRVVGARLVLFKEDSFRPQLAIGAFDVTGSGYFSSRYMALSKMIGPFDLTVGLGQGILAGEYLPDASMAGDSNPAFSFLTSSLFRDTEPFAGLEYHVTSDFTLTAEYSPIDYSNLLGMRDPAGNTLEKGRDLPLNIGFKYRLTPYIHTQFALMGGDSVAAGVSAELPLNPEGLLVWKKVRLQEAGERERRLAHEANKDELAQLLGEKIKAEGFEQVSVRVANESVWIEAFNSVHLSDARALGRMGLTADQLLPERISTLYLNLKEHGRVVQSLRTSRADLRAFRESRTDKDNFLTFSSLELYADKHWQEFVSGNMEIGSADVKDKRVHFEINPRVRSFLNDRNGYLKHKGVLETRADLNLWTGARLSGQFDLTLFNEWDELAFEPLEPSPTATDIAMYERESEPRLSMLALDQYVNLPWNVTGRASGGMFESAYLGVGVEAFRYFRDGLFGIGVESQAVRKRDTEDNFALREDHEDWYYTAFLNLYGQLWPSQGLEGGLKAGRFLGGDPGVRFELRRSFKYFTIGGWYTLTDTSVFQSSENRGHQQAGVYISIPLALFRKSDVPGHLRYTMTNHIRDTGQTVRQPSSLYPMDPWSTPAHTRRYLEDMRIHP